MSDKPEALLLASEFNQLEDTSMIIVSTGLTRGAVVAFSEAIDRRADGLFAYADPQKKVVAAEHERLEAIRRDAVRAEHEADAARRAADNSHSTCAP